MKKDITITLTNPNWVGSLFTQQMWMDIQRMSGATDDNMVCGLFSVEITDTSWNTDDLLAYSEHHDVVFKVVEKCAEIPYERTKFYYHGQYQLIDTHEFHEEYLVPEEYCGGPARQDLFGWSTAKFFSVDEILPIPMVDNEPFVVVSAGGDKIELAHYDIMAGTWDTPFPVEYWKRIG